MIDSLLMTRTLDHNWPSASLTIATYSLLVVPLELKTSDLSPGVVLLSLEWAIRRRLRFLEQDFKPEYYLTTTSVGYMHDFNKHVSAMIDYDHYFYSDTTDTYTPYTNAISVTPLVEFKPVTFSVYVLALFWRHPCASYYART